MGDVSFQNLWTLKAILCSFEMVSGLRVIFYKSKLYGMINVDDNFLQAAEVFLHCNVASLPLKFLGIPTGLSPRRCGLWEAVIESFRKKLVGWKGKLMSIGERVVLLNSVLSSLHLYFFSFYKVSSSIIKKSIAIQKQFLWARTSNTWKISWISWSKICLPKVQDGLGVKNMEWFNMSLLAKWRWHFLNDNFAIWCDLCNDPPHRYDITTLTIDNFNFFLKLPYFAYENKSNICLDIHSPNNTPLLKWTYNYIGIVTQYTSYT